LPSFLPLTESGLFPQNKGVNSAPKDRSGIIAILVVCLFGLPFAGFGLLAFLRAIKQIGAPPGGQSFWYPLMFGLIFSGIGFGLIFLVLFGSKSYARQRQLQAEHPAEPWLWRADWAAGRVQSRTENNLILTWVGTIFWNLISFPVAIFVVPMAVTQKDPVAYAALVFPAVGIFLLVYAIRQTIAFLEFGKTYFEMASVPGVVGRELKGCIQARFPHSPDHGVTLRLSSVHRYETGSGNTQSTHENILWREEKELNPGQLCPGPTGTTIPVAFKIPFNAQPTEKVGPRDEFLWLLEATANVPGIDYHDIFEIPVFRTAQSPTEAEAVAEEAAFAAPAIGATRPQQPTIQVRPVADGTEFYFAAARNTSFGISTTIFAAIFGGIGYFLTHTRAPFIFPVAFGGFGLLIGYISVQMWLGTTRVVIGSSLTLQSGLLGGGKVKQIALTDIATITDRITSQQGGGTGTPYYDIEMTLQSGKKLTLGRTVRDKQEAEWLVGEMRRLTSLDKKSMTAGMA
jgi:MFS family permease